MRAPGVVWTDEGLFAEAETALRSALAAARAIARRDVAGRAALGLARALMWQERLPEALAALEELSGPACPEASCEALALASRVHATAGDVASALGAASQALGRSSSPSRSSRPGLCSSSDGGVAPPRRGDVAGAESHVRLALRAASAAHLPLMALRLRALLLRTLRTSKP